MEPLPIEKKNSKAGNANQLFSWGFSKYGQIGKIGYLACADVVQIDYSDIIQSKSENDEDQPISVIVCGEFNSGFLTSEGKLFLLGRNTFGQLGCIEGVSFIALYPSPVKVNEKVVFELVALGGEHAIALTTSGKLYSWGLNVFGQLGLGHTENQFTPALVQFFATIVDESSGTLKEISITNGRIIEIAAGAQHSLILTSANSFYSCGFAKNGSLGYFTGKDHPNESAYLTKVPLLQTFQKYSKIACGVNHSGCVVGSNEVLIWGRGPFLTYDSFTRINLQEVSVNRQLVSADPVIAGLESIIPIAEIKIGEDFFIIRSEFGDLYSCGSNEFGQLGIGQDCESKAIPEQVQLQERIYKVSVGYNYVLAQGVNNKIYGWGSSQYGQLLDLTQQKYFLPIEIETLSMLGPIDIECGAYHALMMSNKEAESRRFCHDDDSKLVHICKYYDPFTYDQEMAKIAGLMNKRKSLEKDIEIMEKKIKHLQKQTASEVVFNEEIKLDDIIFPDNKQLGSGTTSTVKRGFWRNTEVAVKLLRPSKDGDNLVLIQTFIEELHLLKKLRHPNILLYIGASTTYPNFFLVTEYCDNGTLFELLHTKKIMLSDKKRVKIAIEIARGVNYLHLFNPPVIHRDLKSLNILLDSHLHVKIADFGFARLKESYMSSRRGTLQWMAPEVYNDHTYTEKADVYSYAIILWELWVQQPPYYKIDPKEVITNVSKIKTYRPKLRAEIPEEIKTLITKCWDYDPENRPCFTEIIAELTKYHENLK